MNPVSKALDEIKYRIPKEILTEAFMDPVSNWRNAPISLDEMMLNQVIRPRVLYDCDLVGGVIAIVSLENLQPYLPDNFTYVYTIPKSRTQNRSIISVLSVNYLPYAGAYLNAGGGYGGMGGVGSNLVTSASQRVSDSHSPVPAISVAYVDLVGENTIMFRDQYRVTQAYFIRCILANEENLNNLNPRSYIAFAKLCELAIKSYIYNKMLIKIDQAYLEGGQELGAFKAYIESLSDSEENYQTYIKEVWQAVSKMNDMQGYDRFIKLQVSPGL